MSQLGRGSFWKVKLVLNTEEGNKPYAMKMLSKARLSRVFLGKRSAIEQVKQEIAIMKRLVRNTSFNFLGPCECSAPL